MVEKPVVKGMGVALLGNKRLSGEMGKGVVVQAVSFPVEV